MNSELIIARNNMILSDIIGRGIDDPVIIRAMSQIPRHHFVPSNFIDAAYSDTPLPIGYGQTISQPYIVALMVSMLNLKANDKVLEIGGGCGYQTAILASIAKYITSVEIIPELAESARITLAELGIKNAKIIIGDGSVGWMEDSPYQAIIISAASPKIPKSLLRQLSDGGVLVSPVGTRTQQQLEKWTKEGGKFKKEKGILVSFVPLIGEHGW